MSFANSTVLFLVFRFWAEISRTLSVSYYVVAEPLVRDWECECVAKAILDIFVGGAALMNTKRGRTTPLKKKIFDSTKGFPGEDVAQATSN